MAVPRPRMRSSRGALPCRRPGASRAICEAGLFDESNDKAVTAATSDAPSIAAPDAFAQRIALPSSFQSQAGVAPVACGASRGSRRPVRRVREAIMSVATRRAELLVFNELLILAALPGVHAGGRVECG